MDEEVKEFRGNKEGRIDRPKAVKFSIAEDYIHGLGTIPFLAEKYEVPVTTVQRWCKEGMWSIKRAEYEKNKVEELVPPALPPLFGEICQTPYVDGMYLRIHAKKFYDRLPELQLNIDRLRERIIQCDSDKMLPGLVRAYNESMITWARMLRLPLDPPEGLDAAVTEPKAMGNIEAVDAAQPVPPPPQLSEATSTPAPPPEPTGNIEPL